ncbi:MAG: rubrerythrin family protein [Ignavibacteriota bacterium]
MQSRLIYLFSFLLIFAVIAGCGKKEETPKVSDADKQKLVQHLKDAFTGESTASAKYEAYSRKAKEEGFDNIAKLFEAASKSEAFHVKNHKAVLEKLGEKAPEVKPEFTVKTTKENLEDAIKGETHEATNMYPEFKKLSDSMGETGKDASKSFDFAMRTEAKHKVFYEDALKALDGKTVDKLPSAYWVCPVCGNTVTNEADIKKCTICKNEKEPWVKI